ATGSSIATDPVDGTWALLNWTAGFGIPIAALRDGEPWLGLVLQPATGELTYGASDRPTRLLQLPIFGEAPRAYDLPLEPVTAHGVLVDLHPNRGHGPLSTVLNAAWRGNTLHMVRSSGGSPTVALAEAARGRFIYVNRWSGRAASPYDLAAGALLLEGAGGCLRTPSGREVDPLRHRGPLVAGVDHAAVDKICALLGGGLESLPEPRPGPGDG
ncbi:MAG: inositol monophosphatase family protein, partial [Acidobacteriota bacterium]